MDRQTNLDRLQSTPSWDIVVIGGGATGLGTAVDAAQRGYRVALFEQADFAKGTSSRSTKLIHGGVRYLQQFDVAMVRESLHERNRLCRNAPHLVRPLEFIVPSYRWYDSAYYGIGLKVYDALAGQQSIGKSRHLSKRRTIERLPTIQQSGLRGGTSYVDATFDDARLAVALARTADAHGALLLNYTSVLGFQKTHHGRIEGVIVRDRESGQEHEVRATVVINATGPFVDEVRRLDDPDQTLALEASQGVHLVLDASFLPGDSALLIPRTSDGRVLFAVPWHGVTLIGTTDTPMSPPTLEPQPQAEELEFLLSTANQYLTRPVTFADVRSVFVGIRPLVKAKGRNTAQLSRGHSTFVHPRSGLLTVAGGKWTTYRNMAEDIVNQAAAIGGLDPAVCETERLRLHGACEDATRYGALGVYGADAPQIQRMMREDVKFASRVHPDLAMPVAEVLWACREEMARTVEDVLARRSRWLFLDARCAKLAAQNVADILAEELGRDSAWIEKQVSEFHSLADGYILGSQ